MPCIEQKAAELVEAEERWRNEQSIESAASLAMAEPEPRTGGAAFGTDHFYRRFGTSIDRERRRR